MRDAGEPSIIAGITRAVMAEFAIDPARVYVAGLSAGGRHGRDHGRDLSRALRRGRRSLGAAHGAAADVPSAFAAMRGGFDQGRPAPRKRRANGRVRTIVFHGANDKTVNPSNAETILADAARACPSPAQERSWTASREGAPTRAPSITDARGVPHAEHWAIDGLGHAWSGGSPEGSFTDRSGTRRLARNAAVLFGGASALSRTAFCSSKDGSLSTRSRRSRGAMALN